MAIGRLQLAFIETRLVDLPKDNRATGPLLGPHGCEVGCDGGTRRGGVMVQGAPGRRVDPCRRNLVPHPHIVN